MHRRRSRLLSSGHGGEDLRAPLRKETWWRKAARAWVGGGSAADGIHEGPLAGKGILPGGAGGGAEEEQVGQTFLT